MSKRIEVTQKLLECVRNAREFIDGKHTTTDAKGKPVVVETFDAERWMPPSARKVLGEYFAAMEDLVSLAIASDEEPTIERTPVAPLAPATGTPNA